MEWLLHRLRTMELAEVFSRLLDVGRHLVLYFSQPKAGHEVKEWSVGPSFPPGIFRGHNQLEQVSQAVQDRVVAIATA